MSLGLAAKQLLLAVPQSLCAYPSSRKVRFHLEDRYAYEQSRRFLELGFGPRYGCPGTDPSFPQRKGTVRRDLFATIGVANKPRTAELPSAAEMLIQMDAP